MMREKSSGPKAQIIFKNLVLITGRQNNCLSAVLPAASNHTPLLQYYLRDQPWPPESVPLNYHKISIRGLTPGPVAWEDRKTPYCPGDGDTAFNWIVNVNDYWEDIDVLPEAFNIHAGLSTACIHLARGALATASFVGDSDHPGHPAKIYLDGDPAKARAVAFSVSWTIDLSQLGRRFVIRLEDRTGIVTDYVIPVINNLAKALIDNRPRPGMPYGVGRHFRQFETVVDDKFDDYRPGKAQPCRRGDVPVKNPEQNRGTRSDQRPENCWPGEC